MSELPTGFCVAQAVGLSGAAWLSGNIACYSLATVPALIRSWREHQVPITLVVKQWRECYLKGKAQNPPVAVVTSGVFLYLAWAVRDGTGLAPLTSPHSVSLYTAAAAFTLGIVPWTLAAMAGTNGKLLDRAGATWMPSDESNQEAEGLLKRWVCLNGIRSLFPLVGFVLGFLAF